jgi:DNA-directed RNA polymerase subunit M/transcription elongation factor TFIIS
MKISNKRYECSKCGNSVGAIPNLAEDKKNKSLPQSEAIFIIEDSRKDAPEISQICPKCGNNRAIHWSSTFSGEHAGISQERTVKHYRCTECKHSWAETR